MGEQIISSKKIKIPKAVADEIAELCIHENGYAIFIQPKFKHETGLKYAVLDCVVFTPSEALRIFDVIKQVAKERAEASNQAKEGVA